MRFVTFAGENPQARGVHRQSAGEGKGLLAGFERLQIGNKHLVGHDRARAQHFGAADRQSRSVLIDDLRNQLLRLRAPVLGAIGLGVNDDIGEK